MSDENFINNLTAGLDELKLNLETDLPALTNLQRELLEALLDVLKYAYEAFGESNYGCCQEICTANVCWDTPSDYNTPALSEKVSYILSMSNIGIEKVPTQREITRWWYSPENGLTKAILSELGVSATDDAFSALGFESPSVNNLEGLLFGLVSFVLYIVFGDPVLSLHNTGYLLSNENIDHVLNSLIESLTDDDDEPVVWTELLEELNEATTDGISEAEAEQLILTQDGVYQLISWIFENFQKSLNQITDLKEDEDSSAAPCLDHDFGVSFPSWPGILWITVNAALAVFGSFLIAGPIRKKFGTYSDGDAKIFARFGIGDIGAGVEFEELFYHSLSPLSGFGIRSVEVKVDNGQIDGDIVVRFNEDVLDENGNLNHPSFENVASYSLQVDGSDVTFDVAPHGTDSRKVLITPTGTLPTGDYGTDWVFSFRHDPSVEAPIHFNSSEDDPCNAWTSDWVEGGGHRDVQGVEEYGDSASEPSTSEQLSWLLDDGNFQEGTDGASLLIEYILDWYDRNYKPELNEAYSVLQALGWLNGKGSDFAGFLHPDSLCFPKLEQTLCDIFTAENDGDFASPRIKIENSGGIFLCNEEPPLWYANCANGEVVELTGEMNLLVKPLISGITKAAEPDGGGTFFLLLNQCDGVDGEPCDPAGAWKLIIEGTELNEVVGPECLMGWGYNQNGILELNQGAENYGASPITLAYNAASIVIQKNGDVIADGVKVARIALISSDFTSAGEGAETTDYIIHPNYIGNNRILHVMQEDMQIDCEDPLSFRNELVRVGVVPSNLVDLGVLDGGENCCSNPDLPEQITIGDCPVDTPQWLKDWYEEYRDYLILKLPYDSRWEEDCARYSRDEQIMLVKGIFALIDGFINSTPLGIGFGFANWPDMTRYLNIFPFAKKDTVSSRRFNFAGWELGDSKDNPTQEYPAVLSDDGTLEVCVECCDMAECPDAVLDSDCCECACGRWEQECSYSEGDVVTNLSGDACYIALEDICGGSCNPEPGTIVATGIWERCTPDCSVVPSAEFEVTPSGTCTDECGGGSQVICDISFLGEEAGCPVVWEWSAIYHAPDNGDPQPEIQIFQEVGTAPSIETINLSTAFGLCGTDIPDTLLQLRALDPLTGESLALHVQPVNLRTNANFNLIQGAPLLADSELYNGDEGQLFEVSSSGWCWTEEALIEVGLDPELSQLMPIPDWVIDAGLAEEVCETCIVAYPTDTPSQQPCEQSWLWIVSTPNPQISLGQLDVPYYGGVGKTATPLTTNAVRPSNLANQDPLPVAVILLSFPASCDDLVQNLVNNFSVEVLESGQFGGLFGSQTSQCYQDLQIDCPCTPEYGTIEVYEEHCVVNYNGDGQNKINVAHIANNTCDAIQGYRWEAVCLANGHTEYGFITFDYQTANPATFTLPNIDGEGELFPASVWEVSLYAGSIDELQDLQGTKVLSVETTTFSPCCELSGTVNVELDSVTTCPINASFSTITGSLAEGATFDLPSVGTGANLEVDTALTIPSQAGQFNGAVVNWSFEPSVALCTDEEVSYRWKITTSRTLGTYGTALASDFSQEFFPSEEFTTVSSVDQIIDSGTYVAEFELPSFGYDCSYDVSSGPTPHPWVVVSASVIFVLEFEKDGQTYSVAAGSWSPENFMPQPFGWVNHPLSIDGIQLSSTPNWQITSGAQTYGTAAISGDHLTYVANIVDGNSDVVEPNITFAGELVDSDGTLVGTASGDVSLTITPITCTLAIDEIGTISPPDCIPEDNIINLSTDSVSVGLTNFSSGVCGEYGDNLSVRVGVGILSNNNSSSITGGFVFSDAVDLDSNGEATVGPLSIDNTLQNYNSYIVEGELSCTAVYNVQLFNDGEPVLDGNGNQVSYMQVGDTFTLLQPPVVLPLTSDELGTLSNANTPNPMISNGTGDGSEHDVVVGGNSVVVTFTNDDWTDWGEALGAVAPADPDDGPDYHGWTIHPTSFFADGDYDFITVEYDQDSDGGYELAPAPQGAWSSGDAVNHPTYHGLIGLFDTYATGNATYRITAQKGSCTTIVTIKFEGLPEFVLGCTNEQATNYNALANVDDGNCIIEGCTNPDADNYNPDATVDDGSCFISVLGCTDETAFNYNPDANTDDDSCVPVVVGCLDQNAINYNSDANTSDGSCEYNDECWDYDQFIIDAGAELKSLVESSAWGIDNATTMANADWLDELLSRESVFPYDGPTGTPYITVGDDSHFTLKAALQELELCTNKGDADYQTKITEFTQKLNDIAQSMEQLLSSRVFCNVALTAENKVCWHTPSIWGSQGPESPPQYKCSATGTSEGLNPPNQRFTWDATVFDQFDYDVSQCKELLQKGLKEVDECETCVVVDDPYDVFGFPPTHFIGPMAGLIVGQPSGSTTNTVEAGGSGSTSGGETVSTNDEGETTTNGTATTLTLSSGVQKQYDEFTKSWRQLK